MPTRAIILAVFLSAQSFAQSPAPDQADSKQDELSIDPGSSAVLEGNFADAPGKISEPTPPYGSRVFVKNKTKFFWKDALGDSLKILALQNGLRIATQQKTRDGLSGPFFPDYAEALKRKQSPSQKFMDGDSWGTNFVLHPLQGSTIYQIARLNGASRTHAFLWGVAYSTQFELGPLGEAGIGNVGISPVDLVVTPTAGFLLGVTEEWLWAKLEKRVDNRVTRFARTLLVGNLISRFVVRH